MDICRERHFQAFVCDALAVPIRGGACDACVSVAVIHHFATAVSAVSLSLSKTLWLWWQEMLMDFTHVDPILAFLFFPSLSSYVVCPLC